MERQEYEEFGSAVNGVAKLGAIVGRRSVDFHARSASLENQVHGLESDPCEPSR